MKKRFYILMACLAFTSAMVASPQLTYKLANPKIIQVSSVDWFSFDLQVKADVAGSYLWTSQVNLNFNNSALGTAASDWFITIVSPFSGISQNGGAPKYAFTKGISGTPKQATIIVHGDVNCLPFGPSASDFVEITTSFQTYANVRVKITDNTAQAGMSFALSQMNGQNAYISGPNVTSNYTDPSVINGSVFDVTYLGRLYSNAWGWTQTGGTVSWTSAVNTTVWDGTGSISASDFSTASTNHLNLQNDAILYVPANKWLTVSGNLSNPGTAGNLIVASGGSLITGGSISGQATVERSVSSLWHFISSPVSDALSGLFSGDYLQYFSEADNQYHDIIPTTVPLTPVQGFALWGGTGINASYAGTLNTGVQSFSTSWSGAGHGWNLVGNPYPSSIDWKAAGWTKTNINPTIYIESSNNYATFNATTNASVNGGTQYIAPGQGFFVQATAAGTLGMDNSVRVHNATAFLKHSNEYIPNLLRLQLSGNGYTDEALVLFRPDATPEFDNAFDAIKFFGEVADAAQLYTLGSTPLAINTLPETTIVRSGVYVGAPGTYTLAATELNDINQVTLEDIKTGIFTDLTTHSYTFDGMPGDPEQRFILHFNSVGTSEPGKIQHSVYALNKSVYIELNQLSEATVFIYNASGSLVKSAEIAGGLNKFPVPTTGIYIVKLVTSQSSLVKKVLVE